MLKLRFNSAALIGSQGKLTFTSRTYFGFLSRQDVLGSPFLCTRYDPLTSESS